MRLGRLHLDCRYACEEERLHHIGPMCTTAKGQSLLTVRNLAPSGPTRWLPAAILQDLNTYHQHTHTHAPTCHQVVLLRRHLRLVLQRPHRRQAGGQGGQRQTVLGQVHQAARAAWAGRGGDKQSGEQKGPRVTTTGGRVVRLCEKCAGGATTPSQALLDTARHCHTAQGHIAYLRRWCLRS